MAQEIITLECTEAKALGAVALHVDSEQEEPPHAKPAGKEKIQSFFEAAYASPGNQVIMQPKTAKRRSAFRRANRTMPRRRIDIATEAIDYKNPDLLRNS